MICNGKILSYKYMDKEETRKKIYYYNAKMINLAMLFIYSAFFIFTPLSLYARSVILYPCIIIWAYTAIIIDKKWLKNSKYIFLFFALYGILIFIDNLLIGTTQEIVKFIKSESYFFIFTFMGCFYLQNFKKFDFKYFIITMMAMLFVSYILTLVGNIIYPNASRDLASGYNKLTDRYKMMEIGRAHV